MTDTFDKNEYQTKLQDAWIPSYPAIYNLFLGANSNSVNETTKDDLEQAVLSFQTAETIGEVTAKPVSEGSTEMARFKSSTKTKEYVKYLSGIAWKKKGLNANYSSFASISNQALNKILAQEDQEFLTGRDANGIIRNNGLFGSNDPDYVIETLTGAVPTSLSALKTSLDADLKKIRKQTSGVKYLFSWGALNTALTSFPTEDSTRTKQEILQSNIADLQFINPISDITAGAGAGEVGVGGYLIITPSAIRMHYGLLTKILGLGYNEEETRIWMNIGFNSKSVEVLTQLGAYKKIWTA